MKQLSSERVGSQGLYPAQPGEFPHLSAWPDTGDRGLLILASSTAVVLSAVNRAVVGSNPTLPANSPVQLSR